MKVVYSGISEKDLNSNRDLLQHKKGVFMGASFLRIRIKYLHNHPRIKLGETNNFTTMKRGVI